MSDGDLIQAYLDGSEHAFTTLVERYGPLVLAVALRITRDGQLAEDALQATFLVLVQKARSLRSKGSLAAWMHSTARNTALDCIRRRARSFKRDQEMAMAVPPVEHSERSEWDEIQPYLDAALQELPTVQREAIVLRFLRQLPQEDAAREAGCSEHAFSMRVHRGLELLREKLQRHSRREYAGGALAVLLLNNPAPPLAPHLLSNLTATCLGSAAASAAVTATVKGVIPLMFWNKVKVAAAILLAILVVGGAGAYTAANSAHWTQTARSLPALKEPSLTSPVEQAAAPRQRSTPTPNPAAVSASPQVKKNTADQKARSLTVRMTDATLAENEKLSQEEQLARSKATHRSLLLVSAEISKSMGVENTDWAIASANDDRLPPDLAAHAKNPWINVRKDKSHWVTLVAIKLNAPSESIWWEWQIDPDGKITKRIETSMAKLFQNSPGQPQAPVLTPAGDF